jgi:hypothetical protein
LRGTITAGMAASAVGQIGFGQSQAVAVGRHGAQRLAAIALGGMQMDAIEIIARLFGGDGEAGFVDQTRELARRSREADRKVLARHDREVARRQHRQIKARPARRQRQARIISAPLQRHLAAFWQFARNLIKRMSGRRDVPFLGDVRFRLLHDLHIQIGRRQAGEPVLRPDQHIGEDRNRVAPFHDGLHVSEGFQERGALNRQLHLSPLPMGGESRESENRRELSGIAP